MKASNDTITALDETTSGLRRVLGDSPARWAMEGWAGHLQPARHQVHAINSFVKHEGEFAGELLWAAAFALTLARCCDFGMRADDAAREIHARRTARSLKAA
jgi:hypothetical protein